MPNYKYKAQTLEGKTVTGRANAQNEQELYSNLKADGMFLIESSEVEVKDKSRKRLKPIVLADFCRQLGTLLGAGVSLVRALSIIASEDGLNPKLKAVYVDMLTIIRQGSSLSDAMEAQGDTFPPMLYYMIRSAEASGSVDKAAMRMSEHYNKEHKLNGKVTAAMIYPAILSVIIVIVIIILITFVLPKFESLFAMMPELPMTTRALLGISHFVGKFWYIIIIAIVAIVVLCRALLRKPENRIKVDKVKLKIPKVGKLLKIIYTARFSRTLSSLYGSGITMINALQIARSTIGNAYIESQFDQVLSTIRQGNPLSKGVSEVDGFEKKLASTILVGEETGSLNTMLDAMADAYDHEADLAVTKLVAFIEPVMIIVMAVIVGFVMLSIIQPIYGSYSEIGADQSSTYESMDQ